VNASPPQVSIERLSLCRTPMVGWGSIPFPATELSQRQRPSSYWGNSENMLGQRLGSYWGNLVNMLSQQIKLKNPLTKKKKYDLKEDDRIK
jgi:hypothetical protein